MNRILQSASDSMSLLFQRHRLCPAWCVHVCVCVRRWGCAGGIWIWVDPARSSPAKWAITHINTIKKHFTIWCFQSTTRDNISNWQQNCLDAICVCTGKGWGWGCGSLSVCVRFCASVHGHVSLRVCLQWGVITPLFWPCLLSVLFFCDESAIFLDIPYLQFILRSINQPLHKILPPAATLRCTENKIWYTRCKNKSKSIFFFF